MNQEHYSKILKEHIKTLKNLNIKNDSRLVISFSAVPCSGKSYISNSLEKRYKAVKIKGDILYKIIPKFLGEENLEKNKTEYIYKFLKEYNFPNKLIILDKSLDRTYEETKKIINSINFKLTLVKIPFNKELIENRAKKRLKKDYLNFKNNISGWENDFKNFSKQNKENIIFTNLKDLYKKLDKIISPTYS